MTMKFPVSKIEPVQAKLEMGALDKPALEVSFKRFEIPMQNSAGAHALLFDAPLSANFISLPCVDLGVLQTQSFGYPVNPAEGYIDASVYFEDVHNPVDITNLEFGPLVDGRLKLTVVSRWLMSYEGTAFDDFDLVFSVSLGD
ncbi:hypothetical protein [Shimia marina]|nr:hypothetical protein [Shimia marina]